MTHVSSVDSLRELIRSKDKNIVKVSQRSYILSNGIDYCCVILKSDDGTDFMIQALGKDARELYEEGMLICSTSDSQR